MGEAGWRAYVNWLLGGLLGGLCTCFVAIVLANPYRNLPISSWNDSPMMDTNQRFQYPALARNRNYDSAVFGTSTGRLLRPEKLESLFGGSFAQMSMNSAAAYEQSRMAALFLRHHPDAKYIIMTIDSVWCITGDTFPKTAGRRWPEWMFDENPWNDLPKLMDGKTVELVGRSIAYHLGLDESRYDDNGYRDFTPGTVGNYDSAKALNNIYGASGKREPASEADLYTATELFDLMFPTHALMGNVVEAADLDTRIVLAFMPYHFFYQGAEDSRKFQLHRECKKRMAAGFAGQPNVSIVDFMFHSPLTKEDGNYWDQLHYRTEIADHIVDEMAKGLEGGLSSDVMRVVQ